MKQNKIASIFLLGLLAMPATGKIIHPVDYVNPAIGTAIKGEGGMVPFVGPPFAMTNFLPQTRENKMGSMAYVYDDTSLMGFLASHQPAVWMGDYGYVSLMPQVGEEVRVLPQERAMDFTHRQEQMSPYSYTVTLTDSRQRSVKAELTATGRCGLMRFTFPRRQQARVVVQGINLNPALGDWCNHYDQRLRTLRGWVKVLPGAQEIVGYNPDRQSAQLGPDLPNFKGYFVIRFDVPFQTFGCWNDTLLYPSAEELTGTRMGAYVSFPAGTRKVNVQVATSFISLEQARANLQEEVADASFEEVQARTREVWNEKLSHLQVEGASDTEARIFYTAQYHSYLFPREFSEQGRYYSAFDDTVHTGFSYTDYSLWDTFRAYHPLMTLLEPTLTGHWITALLQMYREGGWLPMWPNPSYTNIMIATHADALIADAYLKGIRNYDVPLAYEAIRKDAFTPPDGDTYRRYGDRDYWTSYEGRAGASFYHSLGYVPNDRTAESVSRTLEYAYDDWCVAQMARALGHQEEARRLESFSRNYVNLYNGQEGFFLPRNYDGSWVKLDDHSREGLTEGSKWTYLFCVLQDIPGLIHCMGGTEAFAAKLDRNFNENHYRHDNEPGHHYAYLYDYCGQPWKTQELVRKHTRENYHNTPDGLNGNDDCGQMSAWYLFSVMGFYPVTPASGLYAIGTPQFPCIRLQLPTHTLTITASGLSENAPYVQAAYLDGQPLKEPFISHTQLLQARELRFVMGDKPHSWNP